MTESEEKALRGRVDYMDRVIYKKLIKLGKKSAMVAFMADLFGHRGPEEFERLCAIYPELF